MVNKSVAIYKHNGLKSVAIYHYNGLKSVATKWIVPTAFQVVFSTQSFVEAAHFVAQGFNPETAGTVNIINLTLYH